MRRSRGPPVTIAVRALPPRPSLSSQVSTESRYGTWPPLSLARAEMTVPSVESDLLIAPASCDGEVTAM